MEQNPMLIQNVDTLFSNLENFTQNEGLIGKAVSHEDKTFLPVVSVTMGYGSGSAAGKNKSNSSNQQSSMGMGMNADSMTNGALGLGAKLNTEAVIVIDKGNVSIMPLTGAGGTSQIMDKIPQIISNMTSNQQGQQGQQGQSKQ